MRITETGLEINTNARSSEEEIKQYPRGKLHFLGGVFRNISLWFILTNEGISYII